MRNWPKGPWFVREFGKTADGDDYHFVQAGGPSVGDGWDDDGKYMVISGVISRDAANLISAAPDLFDALQTIYGKLLIYSSTERFLADFGDDIEATRCASYFKENCNGKNSTARRRKIC